MRDAASSGRKRLALSNWDLRWKVTAVLAVPLLVAVVLGASRISAEFAESSRLTTAVDNVAVIPAITGLSGAAATVAAGQMTMVNGQSMTSDPELAQLDTAIQFAELAVPRLSDIPSARSALDNMIVGAKAVRANGLTPSPSVSNSLVQVEDIRGHSVRTVENIVSSVSDRFADAAKLRLVDSLNARAAMVGEIAGAAEALRGNVKDGLQDFTIAANTERQLLGILASRFPDGDPIISELQRLVDTRIQLVSSPEVAAGVLPVVEIKDLLASSLAQYQTIVNNATKDVVSRVDNLASTARTDAIRYAVIVIATILGALALAVLMARAMIVPLRRLRLAALRVAEHDLAQEVSALREGADPEDVPLEPMPVETDEEIGQLARAVDDIHGQALRLAADQAAMRTQVNDMFETLARRSKSLVDHQLSLIEAMEYDEKDPRLLENLFRLDHLAARMRRNGDNLLILAGTKQRRTKSAPVEIADVLRAAISEVEDYERVKLGATPRGALTEPAASDMAHLFAELLDNALRASPPETDVKFTFAQAPDTGLLIEVSDRGIGMPPAEMAEINRRLETTAEVGPDTARHMGLFVVGRLAERHGLTVRLRPTFDVARDPGVTVTVHVPNALIVTAAGAGLSVPPQPGGQQQPAPMQPGSQQAPSSMQMRAVTRTATGNVMVTVDPGGSGPIPAGAPQPGAPAPAAASASGGLPQRAPGDAGASVGLPQRDPGAAGASVGLPQRQPGTSGPTVRHTVSAPGGGAPGGLPQREPGVNSPVAPQSQAGANLQSRQGDAPAQPRAQLAANMMRRQPGPGGPGGMPPRPGSTGAMPQRPGPGAPQGPGGPPPQRGDASGGLPPRDPSAGGLPQRAPGTNGAPPREPGTGGLPQRDPSVGGPPQRSAQGGLPQRDPGANGAPPREPGTGGLPQRDPSVGGPPQRSAQGGLPQRDPGSSGAPQRDPNATGLPGREPGGNGMPPRDGGRPQREAASGGLPQRDGGLPQRPGGLPQREGGLPPRDGGLPQRDSGLPQRDSGLPQREAASGGLPQRDSGLPQRDSGLPQRDSGLPQRDTMLPQRESALPQRESTPLQRDTGLPQRDAAPSTGLPQRPAPGGLPQRSGPGGLPQREPGAGLPQRPPPVPGLGGSSDDAAGPGKHSFRSNPTKAASFFQTRLQPANESEQSLGTPIFAEMMSAWLVDPNADRSQVASSFESPGDEGWQAARRAVESQADKRTAAGLPQRDPGNRLVPGGVNGNADRAARRDPESIRSSLARHQQGVRDGRAQQEMNLTGDKGDR
ncbi:HAMP domain-containing protein [Nocardia uniformis]|uniref:histidine kinase n=2 Tax=Nocardia uniformis TaxID=53432 RepID=A0A849C5M1_9NOCA|nr:ATP-binding protein [Nocardia uniformis]NNH71710.1 HAMP domain-containing protein [Nocardia uniformis]